MNPTRTVIVILAFALAVRLIAVPIGMNQARSRGTGYFDEYGGIAKNIVDGRGFSYAWYGDLRPTSIHSPGYPYVLALVFLIFGTGSGGAMAAMMMNLIISLCLVYAVFKTARELFGLAAGFTVLMLVSFYPGQIYYSVSGLPTILYTSMLFLVVVLTWRLREELSIKNASFWGAAIGLCTLTYSFVMALAPFLALWVIFSSGRKRIGRSITMTAAAALIAIAICVPWTIRNYIVHERWIPIRDQSGTNLWYGNGPGATGGAAGLRANSEETFGRAITDTLRSIPNEVDGDRYLRKLAVEYMKANPKRTMRLWLRKIWMFWWFDSGPVAAGTGLGRYIPVLKILKGALLLFAAAGAILIFRHRPSLVWLGLIVFAVMTSVYMVFFSGRLRYFTPLEPFLIISAGYAADLLAGRMVPAGRSAGGGQKHPDSS